MKVKKTVVVAKVLSRNAHHFDLELLGPRQVQACLANDTGAIDGLVQTIRAGHKGEAHLTMGGRRLAVRPLAAGCRATRRLVDHFLYEALRLPVPISPFTISDETPT